MTDQPTNVLGDTYEGIPVPAKFQNKPFTEVLKSYGELERARSQPANPDPAPQPRNPAPNRLAPQVPGGDDPMAAFMDEFQRTGTLSPQSRAQVEAVVGPGRVDIFLEGVKATQAQAHKAAFEITGGEENYDAMLAWMSRGGLSHGELQTFNQAVGAANPHIREMAIRAAWSKYQSNPENQSPNLVREGGGGTPFGVYGSRQELALDQSNPLYRKPGPEGDAHRSKVMAKIAASRKAKVAGF